MRRPFLLAIAAAAALAAAGCGSDDNGSASSSSTSTTAPATEQTTAPGPEQNIMRPEFKRSLAAACQAGKQGYRPVALGDASAAQLGKLAATAKTSAESVGKIDANAGREGDAKAQIVDAFNGLEKGARNAQKAVASENPDDVDRALGILDGYVNQLKIAALFVRVPACVLRA
jgi:hypothetical protein